MTNCKRFGLSGKWTQPAVLPFALALGLNSVLALPMLAKPQADTSKTAVQIAAAIEEHKTSQALIDAAAAYKAQPNDTTWSEVFNQVKSVISLPTAKQMLIGSTSPVAELRIKLIEYGSARVYSFPEISQAHQVLVEWRESKTQPVVIRKGKKKKVVQSQVVTSKIQAISIPASTLVSDARILDLLFKDKTAATTSGGKFLILAGSNRSTQGIWVDTFRLTGGTWTQDAEPLAQIPTMLLHSLTGQAYFSGSDLVFAVKANGATVTTTEQTTADKPKTKGDAYTYKLALRFVEGKYELEGKPLEDTPLGTVTQFLNAVRQGHMDMAKAWLSDPKLVSIPRYMGLTTKGSTYRLMGMSSTQSGNYRYRLVTFDKNDLIFDVAKIKNQWTIKAIFIAPANAVLQKIAKVLPPMSESVETMKPALLPDAGNAASNKSVAGSDGQALQ
jgi:hypothetical protein